LPKYQFTVKYYNHETHKEVDFSCDEEPLASGFCIFHDKDYLQYKTNYEEHKRKVLDRLKHKVNDAISNNEPLLCIGFQLPDFSLSNLSNSKEFTKPVYFNCSRFFESADFMEAKFQGKADFSRAKFQAEANFSEANFKERAYFYEANFQGEANFEWIKFEGEAFFRAANFQGEANFEWTKFEGGPADFSGAKFQGEAFFRAANFQGKADFSNSEFYRKTYFSGHFNGKTIFHYVLFEGKEKVIFDIENLSNVSFMNTDITGVRFSDKARWWSGGTGKKTKEDRFKIVDEKLLEEEIKEKDTDTIKDFNLGSVKAVYRNLRENYEYRMRYDEAGQFFIREMELKRKYREVPSSKEGEENRVEIKQNNWFVRNLFSLTGWYYHLSRYGESLWRPTLAGLVIVFLSTLFWLTQNNPLLQPTLNATIVTNDANLNYTTSTINTNGSLNNNQIVDANKLVNKTANYFIGFQKVEDPSQWLKAFERSLADFLPLLPTGDFNMGIIDFVIKIIGGAVTFGLIAIALRRRFERRYRH
jgi:uncharacterized protein YjbI with pentapeptide repeats